MGALTRNTFIRLANISFIEACQFIFSTTLANHLPIRILTQPPTVSRPTHSLLCQPAPHKLTRHTHNITHSIPTTSLNPTHNLAKSDAK